MLLAPPQRQKYILPHIIHTHPIMLLPLSSMVKILSSYYSCPIIFSPPLQRQKYFLSFFFIGHHAFCLHALVCFHPLPITPYPPHHPVPSPSPRTLPSRIILQPISILFSWYNVTRKKIVSIVIAVLYCVACFPCYRTLYIIIHGMLTVTLVTWINVGHCHWPIHKTNWRIHKALVSFLLLLLEKKMH